MSRGKLINPGELRDVSSKIEPYATRAGLRFERSILAGGLVESHCSRCGHMVGASSSTQSLELAEKAHGCR